MFDTIAGRPLHPLVVHATGVVVPAAALVVALAALWPGFRRRERFVPLPLSSLALVLVPVSTQSGEALEERVGGDALIETHSQLAEGLLPWVGGLVVVSGFMLRWYREEPTTTSRREPTWVAVVAWVVSTGTVVQSVRIGHSGATAVWPADMGNPAPASGDSDED